MAKPYQMNQPEMNAVAEAKFFPSDAGERSALAQQACALDDKPRRFRLHHPRYALAGGALMLVLIAAVLFTSWGTGGFNWGALTAKAITLNINGVDEEHRLQGDTVAEALAEVGISLASVQNLSHDPSAPIQNGMVIAFDCIGSYQIVVDGETITKTIPYEIINLHFLLIG